MKGLVIILLILMAASPASPRTWYVSVDGKGDVPSIQAAIDTAAAGDEILVGPGRYTWTNQGGGDQSGMIRFLTRYHYVTLRSEAGPEATVLDAEYRNRVIYCHGMNYVTVEGFTITRGVAPEWGDYCGGGFFTHIPGETVRNCIFIDNSAEFGGGISCVINDRTFAVEDCVFTGNTSSRYGGAVGLANGTGTIEISRSLFSGNSADLGGAGIVVYNCSVDIESCILYGNSAVSGAGAFHIHEGASARVHASTVCGNSSPDAAVSLFGGTWIEFTSTILAFNGCPLFDVSPTASGTIGCSDIFGNGSGNLIPEGITDTGMNLFEDPLFCGAPGSGNYYLRSDSPCWPANRPNGLICAVIGACGTGCGSVAARGASWGAIKSITR